MVLTQTEATAIQRALMITRENGFTDVILVSDCLTMIQRILSSERDRSIVGPVVGDIKLLASGFHTCILKFSGRKTNVATHILAHRSELSICNLLFEIGRAHV